MKKIIALALALMIILCAVPVLADEPAEKSELCSLASFKIQSVIPEGYSFILISSNELQLVGLLKAGEGKALITVSIAYNEEYKDVERFNDVDEETVEEIRESFRVMDDVAFEDLETAYGTRLLKATAADKGFVDIYTIYKGYECEFVITADSVTDADVRMLVDFISDMDFIPVEGE